MNDTSQVLFQGNKAKSNGGAIYVGSSIEQTKNSKIVVPKNTKFIENTAGDFGGAVYLSGVKDNTSNIDQLFFINNTAGKDGGAIFLEGIDKFDISNTKFTSNKSELNGGAIYINRLVKSDSELNLQNNEFRDNIAKDGGAIGLDLGNKIMQEDDLNSLVDQYVKVKVYDDNGDSQNEFKDNSADYSVDSSYYEDEDHILYEFKILLEDKGILEEIIPEIYNNDNIKLLLPVDEENVMNVKKVVNKVEVDSGDDISYKISVKNTEEIIEKIKVNFLDELDMGLTNIKVSGKISNESNEDKRILNEDDFLLESNSLKLKGNIELEYKDELLISITAKTTDTIVENGGKLNNEVLVNAEYLDPAAERDIKISKIAKAEEVTVKEKPIKPIKPIEPEEEDNDNGNEIPYIEEYKVTFDANGGLVEGRKEIVERVERNKTVKTKKDVYKIDYEFLGWSTNKETLEEFDFNTKIRKNIKIYAIWKEKDIKENTFNHIAYLEGYEDGTLRPESDITRAETSAIIYRITDEDVISKMYSDNYIYNDTSYKWSRHFIATLSNGGIVEGYPDGSFRPNDSITRAEVVAMLVRFEGKVDNNNSFNDTKGHWAEEYISQADKNGWVIGYEDGSFRPDDYITRAEFATLINRMLDRSVNKENIIKENLKSFTDLNESKWYYTDMIEASNNHIYHEDRLSDNSELWLEIK